MSVEEFQTADDSISKKKKRNIYLSWYFISHNGKIESQICSCRCNNTNDTKNFQNFLLLVPASPRQVFIMCWKLLKNSPILVATSYIQFNGEYLLKSTPVEYGTWIYYTNIIAYILSGIIFVDEYSEFITAVAIVNLQWQECFHYYSCYLFSYNFGLGSNVMLNIHWKCPIITQNHGRYVYNSKINQDFDKLYFDFLKFHYAGFKFNRVIKLCEEM